MATDALYLQDAYLKSFEATVIEVLPADRAVLLDRTAFFPGGGGQQADAGTLIIGTQKYMVLRAKKAGDKIVHMLDTDDLPPVGSVVRGQINWERRYKAMRTHTAMHILCGVIWRDYQVSVTGGNMELLSARMDFEFATLDRDTIADIEHKVNAEVAAARPVKVKVLPRDEAFQIPDLIRTKVNLLPDHIQEIRTIEIVDLDLQADGGTHVNDTGEVGTIRITKYKSKGGANKRLYIELDE